MFEDVGEICGTVPFIRPLNHIMFILPQLIVKDMYKMTVPTYVSEDVALETSILPPFRWFHTASRQVENLRIVTNSKIIGRPLPPGNHNCRVACYIATIL